MKKIKNKDNYYWWCHWCGISLKGNNQYVPLNEKNRKTHEYFCNTKCKEEFKEANKQSYKEWREKYIIPKLKLW